MSKFPNDIEPVNETLIESSRVEIMVTQSAARGDCAGLSELGQKNDSRSRWRAGQPETLGTVASKSDLLLF